VEPSGRVKNKRAGPPPAQTVVMISFPRHQIELVVKDKVARGRKRGACQAG
jgi:hypothetical protein